MGGGTRKKKKVSFFGQVELLRANMITRNRNESEAQARTGIGIIGCAYTRDRDNNGTRGELFMSDLCCDSTK